MVKPIDVRNLHDRWAAGDKGRVLRELRVAASAAGDRSDRLRLIAQEARFHIQSGNLELARQFLGHLRRQKLDRLGTETRAWIAYSLGFYKYEVARDFRLAEVHLRESAEWAVRAPRAPDVEIMRASALWRLAAIAQQKGNTRRYGRLMDAAADIVRSTADRHQTGILLLARGNRDLGLGRLHAARASFLEGLLCVGYPQRGAPAYLHAELIFGLCRAQLAEAIRSPDPDDLLDYIVALNEAKLVLAGTGRGWIVTPYDGRRVICPENFLKIACSRENGLVPSYRRIPPRLRREFLRTHEARCEWCASELDLTIDHILPQRWGGTSALHNLRVLCRPCNSRRGARFTVNDRSGYLRLIGEPTSAPDGAAL